MKHPGECRFNIPSGIFFCIFDFFLSKQLKNIFFSLFFSLYCHAIGGRKVFRDFLRCEYSEENILFWLACEELKKETNPEAVEEKARFIYEDYISILSPKEVSVGIMFFGNLYKEIDCFKGIAGLTCQRSS
jgi:Regulator of G protein signaling domain